MSAIKLLDYPFKALTENDRYHFDCGDPDLTEFFLVDAIPHQEELVSVTYFFYDDSRKSAIAFFSVSNDALKTDSFRDSLPEGKRYKLYPAVKIGRLGVSKEYQRQNIGGQLVEFIKWFLVNVNKTGCRFLTVDAYNKPGVPEFYLKNGFSFLTEKDVQKQTRAMKYDLKPFCDGLSAKRC